MAYTCIFRSMNRFNNQEDGTMIHWRVDWVHKEVYLIASHTSWKDYAQEPCMKL